MQLVNLINKLYDLLFDEREISSQKEIIGEMIQYAETHFKTEEFYMKKFEFDGYEQHKKEHVSFLEKTMELKNQTERTGFVLNITVLRFLKTWLKEHILGTDKQFTKCFNDNGLF